MARQREQFKTNLSHLARANDTSINVQKDLFERKMGELKLDQLTQLKPYQDKSDDPFYKIQDRGSSFSESEHAYVLRTFIPAHEADKVKVRIQPDKASVVGSRQYKDDVQDDGRHLSTSSYQTYHEEFKFDKPVLHSAAQQQRDGDWLEFTIPKIGTLSKKA